MPAAGRTALAKVRRKLAAPWRDRGTHAKAALRRVGLEPIQIDPSGYAVPTESLRTGYLSEVGWFRSVHEQAIVDADGQPLPWLVYPMIRLLRDRCVDEDLSVFEYGAGSSTVWWAARAARVVAVEHHAEWYAQVHDRVPDHVRLIYAPLDDTDTYETSISRAGGPFDLVVIDGRRRSECSRHVRAELSERGVVVWDNSDRPRYAAAISEFEGLGFRRLDLEGMAPRDNIAAMTSVLYRSGNILGL